MAHINGYEIDNMISNMLYDDEIALPKKLYYHRSFTGNDLTAYIVPVKKKSEGFDIKERFTLFYMVIFADGDPTPVRFDSLVEAEMYIRTILFDIVTIMK